MDTGDAELHLPYAAPHHHTDPDTDTGDLVEPDDKRGRGSADGGQALRMQPPPTGLSRRDRHAWRKLELARLQRDTEAAAKASYAARTGWQQGFIRNPPPGLGRRGRAAWLHTERAATTAWWQQRRASTEDIDARAAGVLVVAVLLGGAVLISAIFTSPAADTRGPSTTAPANAVPATGPAQSPNDSATTGSAPEPAGDAAPPTVAGGVPPVAGRWQPTPAGGVTPIDPVPMSVIDPSAVLVVEAPTGPPTPGELSTPAGAVAAWLARTCPSSWADPYGADLRRGQALMTNPGWAATNPDTDLGGPGLWAAVVADQQTRVCGNFDVQVSADQPTAGGVAFVGYTAARVITTARGGAVVEQVSGSRRVVRQDNGWLVDRPVTGG